VDRGKGKRFGVRGSEFGVRSSGSEFGPNATLYVCVVVTPDLAPFQHLQPAERVFFNVGATGRSRALRSRISLVDAITRSCKVTLPDLPPELLQLLSVWDARAQFPSCSKRLTGLK